MSRRRVVITGLGVVCPVGNSVKEAWANIQAGQSGITRITRFDASPFASQIAGEVKNFDVSTVLSAKEARRVDIFIHYGEDNSQVNGTVEVDGTEWHNWAVEWTPEHIITYLDGREWYRVTDPKVLPPGEMHLCLQLDWFPEDDTKDVKDSSMDVDWIKQYPYPADK